MNIALNNLSFTGQYIADGNVKKNNNGILTDEPVTIVELNPFDRADRRLLKKITRKWDDAVLSSAIRDDAKKVKDNQLDPQDNKFYVVTKQMDKFEKMDADEVLAEAEVKQRIDGRKVSVEFLQVRPDCMYGEENRPYMKVGSAFTDFCKEQFKGKEIVIAPLFEVIDFYVAQGFDANSSEVGTMSYKA